MDSTYHITYHYLPTLSIRQTCLGTPQVTTGYYSLHGITNVIARKALADAERDITHGGAIHKSMRWKFCTREG